VVGDVGGRSVYVEATDRAARARAGAGTGEAARAAQARCRRERGPLGWRANNKLVMFGRGERTPLVVIDGATGAVTDGGTLDTTLRPMLSNDGASVAWLEKRAGGKLALAVAPLGTATPERTFDLGAVHAAGCEFAAGDRRIVCETHAARGASLISVELATGKTVVLVPHADDISVALSPDGDRVAFTTPRGQLMITPIDSASASPIGAPYGPLVVGTWLR